MSYIGDKKWYENSRNTALSSICAVISNVPLIRSSIFICFSSRQHCALITTLICAGSFRQSDAVTALEKYGPTSVTKSFPQGDGWKELLGLNTNISYFLPEDGCAGLPRLITTDQSRQNDQILLGRSDICHEINFIDLVKSATSNDSTTSKNIPFRYLYLISYRLLHR